MIEYKFNIFFKKKKRNIHKHILIDTRDNAYHLIDLNFKSSPTNIIADIPIKPKKVVLPLLHCMSVLQSPWKIIEVISIENTHWVDMNRFVASKLSLIEDKWTKCGWNFLSAAQQRWQVIMYWQISRKPTMFISWNGLL